MPFSLQKAGRFYPRSGGDLVEAPDMPDREQHTSHLMLGPYDCRHCRAGGKVGLVKVTDQLFVPLNHAFE